VTPRLCNAMSVDVEEWFQVQAFAEVIERRQWSALESRVAASTDRVLASFARADVRATFFILGWVAERHPELVLRIAAAGHEVASHGYGHERVDAIGEAAFRRDIRRAKAILEGITGTPVLGYRAPTFSISAAETPWAHRILREEGHGYSSSIFPIHHDTYGSAETSVVPYFPAPDGVVELPMTILRIQGRNLPCSGGGWFRLMPYWLFRLGLRRVNAVHGREGIFYFHPWEVDPDQPRVVNARMRARFRHYVGQRSMARRMERLLGDFAWGRMDALHAAMRPVA
jgi:polysaccharide deacetylase family protein (PEP-CTERM system associated)